MINLTKVKKKAEMLNFGAVKLTNMTLLEAIEARHSVRRYKDEPLQEDVLTTLQDRIREINQEAGLSYSKMDLGIVKCHFEIGAGKDNFVWA